MNVCRSFADLFQNLNMSVSDTNWRECRDALIAYGNAGKHDFKQAPMPWTVVRDMQLKPFPPAPKCLAYPYFPVAILYTIVKVQEPGSLAGLFMEWVWPLGLQ